MRECGMLLPIASLPSKYGIGCFSKEAYEFVDQLKEGGQSFWQILPLGPTGFGDSPYQAFSAFAGNPYFIDLEQLVGEGLLTEDECEEADFGDDDRYIAYDKIYKARFKVLKKAYERWKKDHHQFLKSKLDPETREYCFYMAVKDHFKSASWNKWDEDIRLRKTAAVEKYKKMLEVRWDFYEFQQFQFNEQWSRLKPMPMKMVSRSLGISPSMWLLTGLTAGLIRSCSSLMRNVCQRQWPAAHRMHFQQQASFGEIRCMIGDIIRRSLQLVDQAYGIQPEAV